MKTERTKNEIIIHIPTNIDLAKQIKKIEGNI